MVHSHEHIILDFIFPCRDSFAPDLVKYWVYFGKLFYARSLEKTHFLNRHRKSVSFSWYSISQNTYLYVNVSLPQETVRMVQKMLFSREERRYSG